MYSDDNGLEKSINVAFTSLNIINPFIEINNSRCDFVYEDLMALYEEMIKVSDRVKCKLNCAILQI
jgi:hypothetical protein